MGKIYVGDVGTEIIVDCGEDITNGVDPVLKVLLPDGTEVEWTCSVVETTKLRHVSDANTFKVKGQHKLQAYPNLPNWIGRGKTKAITVYAKYT